MFCVFELIFEFYPVGILNIREILRQSFRFQLYFKILVTSEETFWDIRTHILFLLKKTGAMFEFFDLLLRFESF